MGRPISNIPRSIARVKITSLNYESLLNLANLIVTSLTGNLNFTTPLPTLTVIGADATDLQNALKLRGTKSNKGSAAALVAIKSAAKVVASDLTQILAYVMNTAIIAAPTNPTLQAAIISTSGFAVKSAKSKIPAMQQVQNLRMLNTKKNPMSLGIVRWKKATGLIPGAGAKSYTVLITGPAAFAAVTANVTSCKFVLAAPSYGLTAGVKYTVTVYPINAAGVGAGRSIIATAGVLAS